MNVDIKNVYQNKRRLHRIQIKTPRALLQNFRN